MGENGDVFKKAEAGDAEAQYHIGNFYLYDNKSQSRDEPEAMKWFRKAADQKYAPAEYQVGRMYANGFSVGVNQNEALRWYRMAAEGGYDWAQIHLGEIDMHFLPSSLAHNEIFRKPTFGCLLVQQAKTLLATFLATLSGTEMQPRAT
jgi:uncharacterized protein